MQWARQWTLAVRSRPSEPMITAARRPLSVLPRKTFASALPAAATNISIERAARAISRSMVR